MPNKGCKHSDESRRKISEALRGRPSPNKGKTFPHLQGISKMTPEGKAVISAQFSKDWLVTFPSGHVGRITNLRAFALENGLNPECMYFVARGKQEHHRGFRVQLLRESGAAA